MARRTGPAAWIETLVQNAIARQLFVATVHSVAGGSVSIIRPGQTAPDRDTNGATVFYPGAAGQSYAPGDRVHVHDVGGGPLVGLKY